MKLLEVCVCRLPNVVHPAEISASDWMHAKRYDSSKPMSAMHPKYPLGGCLLNFSWAASSDVSTQLPTAAT